MLATHRRATAPPQKIGCHTGCARIVRYVKPTTRRRWIGRPPPPPVANFAVWAREVRALRGGRAPRRDGDRSACLPRSGFSTTDPRPKCANPSAGCDNCTLYITCVHCTVWPGESHPVIQGVAVRQRSRPLSRIRWGRNLDGGDTARLAHIGVVRYRRSDLHLKSRSDSLAGT